MIKCTDYDKDGKFYIGNKVEIIIDNDLVVGNDEYEGTPGLLELVVWREPKNFTNEDYKNYAELMIKTNALMNVQKAVKFINGILYLKTFGLLGEGMRERELLLFRAMLTRC